MKSLFRFGPRRWEVLFNENYLLVSLICHGYNCRTTISIFLIFVHKDRVQYCKKMMLDFENETRHPRKVEKNIFFSRTLALSSYSSQDFVSFLYLSRVQYYRINLRKCMSVNILVPGVYCYQTPYFRLGEWTI